MNRAGKRDLNKEIPDGTCKNLCVDVSGGKEYCEDVCNSEGSMAKVSVGVIMPKKSPSGMNVYDLCQDGKCVQAGSLGSFGDSANAKLYEGPNPPPINKETYSLRDTDVIATMIAQGWTLKKPLVARMKICVVGCDNMPEPVVMYHQLGKDGHIDKNKTIITLNPKENPENYGNLLDEYRINEVLLNDMKNKKSEPGPVPQPNSLGKDITNNMKTNLGKDIKNNMKKNTNNLGKNITNNIQDNMKNNMPEA